MTVDEAIQVLKDWDGYFIGHGSDDVNKALNMAIKALEREHKIRAEIEKAVWEDIFPIFDETGAITDEIRIPLLNPDDVFEIIDKYKAESEDK